jgi:hypothetical membrane protein
MAAPILSTPCVRILLSISNRGAMKKFLLFLLFCFELIVAASAQQQVPTIHAISGKVDVRVGNDYFQKGGWTLEPSKNPDVFSIGSKWPYENKKVTFITDRDSLSFEVQPGHFYDFVILKDSTPCHIRIRTSNNPLFLNARALGFLGTALLILVFLFYPVGKMVRSKTLMRFGYPAILLFWTMTIVSGQVHRDYNHFRNTISELGAIGTSSEGLTSYSLFFVAAFYAIFCLGFYKASKEIKLNLLPSIVSLVMAIGMIWAGVFTLGNEFHSLLGPLPLLIVLACLLSFLQWKDKYGLRQLAKLSLFSFIWMMLLFTRFIEPFGHRFEGLIQRFFYLGWSMWTIGIIYFLSRYLGEEQSLKKG